MTEFLSVVITLVVTVIIQMLKPEWLTGWFLDLLDKKAPKTSNTIANNLGNKMFQVGVHLMKRHADSEVISQATQIIEEQSKIIANELEHHL